MSHRFLAFFVLALSVAGLAGCKQEPTPNPAVKKAGPPEPPAPAQVVAFPDLATAKTAQQFGQAKEQRIDSKRVYIARPRSSATQALLVAEHEPRIKSCAA